MYEQHYKEDPYTKEKYPQSIYHDAPQSELKWVGNKDVTRVGAPNQVTGRDPFGNDPVWPDQLYLKLKRCPHSHANVTSINTTAAKALPGVVMVLTHDDIPDMIVRAPYYYAVNKECWVEGYPVAAVAATEESIAEEAIDLIEVEYEVLDFILHPDDAEKDEYVLHGDTNEIGSPFVHDSRGDVDAALQEPGLTIVETQTRSVTKPFFGEHPVAGLENESCTCFWENDRMTCWFSTQNPWGSARTVASALGLPQNKCVAKYSRSGVGFGNKGSENAGYVLAGYVSMKTHRPVKWLQDNWGYFSTNRSAWACRMHDITSGVKDDGTLVAYKEITKTAGGYVGSRGASSGIAPVPFRYIVPNLYLEGHDYWTNTEGNGIPRCVHHPNAVFPENIHMDRCAEAIDMDPTDFQQLNVFKDSGVGVHQDNPQYDIGANPNPALIPAVVQLSGWKSKWMGWGNPVAVNGSKKKGIGFALHSCSHGSLSNPESATITSRGDGTFVLNVGSQDVGQGWRTCGQIMAAEELGVDLDKVYSPGFDTDTSQESRSPGGSTVVRGSGTALILACRDLKEQIFQLAIAAELIEATDPEELEMKDNYVFVKSDQTKRVLVDDVCARQNTTHIALDTGTRFGGPMIGRGSYATRRSGGSMGHMQFSAAVVEVEVDTDTGEVTVEKVTEVAADGRTIHWMGELNQISSGIMFSLGHGLYTGTIRDEPTGAILNPDYSLYKIPTHADAPEMVIDTYNEIEPYGPFGAKGSGEPVMPPTCGAIINAVYNACGARLHHTHITPDTILTALGKV